MLLSMIVETIRKHIKACGKTRYQISQDTGVDEATLCRIAAGKACSTETGDILLKYFGLTLAKKGKKRTR
jgi:DNA-directed RNA polymerase specialized sigma54-like protein